MNITVEKGYYGCNLIFEAENVKVTEDIGERIYPLDENGKTIFGKSFKQDIKIDVLQQIVNVLDDMIYYRESEFDSSYLIERLFEKLPEDKRALLAESLFLEYREEKEEDSFGK